MRKGIVRLLLITLSLLCAIPASRSFAQSNQIAVGYAIISPGSGASTTPDILDVFETYGFVHREGEQQAGLPAAQMTTTGLMFVDVSASRGSSTAMAFTNPNSLSAQVILTLYREDGSIADRKTIIIPARQQFPQYVTELFPNVSELLGEFTGTLAFDSSVAIAAISLRFKGSVFSTEPISQLSDPEPIPPIGTVSDPLFIVPNVVAGGGWATEIVILNPASSTATVRLDFFSSSGFPQSFTINGETQSTFPSFTIRPRGVLVLRTE